ncbi:MAG: hypothetical protein ACSHW0_02090 [Thalassotalea sp.]
MQPKNTKIALIIGALFLGASGASNAATETFQITVNTIDDVTLTQVQALDFGSNILISALGECTMDADTPEAGSLGVGTLAASAAAANYGELSGTGCIDGAVATPGEYTITGTSGASVIITLSSVDAGDFIFTPNSNAFANYDDAAEGDTIVEIGVGTPTPLLLASANDTGTNGTPVDGALEFRLGGKLTIGGADLLASTPYDADFNVNVVY